MTCGFFRNLNSLECLFGLGTPFCQEKHYLFIQGFLVTSIRDGKIQESFLPLSEIPGNSPLHDVQEIWLYRNLLNSTRAWFCPLLLILRNILMYRIVCSVPFSVCVLAVTALSSLGINYVAAHFILFFVLSSGGIAGGDLSVGSLACPGINDREPL